MLPPQPEEQEEQAKQLATENIARAAWSPVDRRLAAWQGRELVVWDTTSGERTVLASVTGDKPSKGPTFLKVLWDATGTRLATTVHDRRNRATHGIAIDVRTGDLWRLPADARPAWWGPDG